MQSAHYGFETCRTPAAQVKKENKRLRRVTSAVPSEITSLLYISGHERPFPFFAALFSFPHDDRSSNRASFEQLLLRRKR